MNKKGFTLVELLGTIVILSLIVVVAFPSLITQLRDSNEEIDESVRRVVEVAARDYVMDHIENYPKPSESAGIVAFEQVEGKGLLSVSFLIDEGYIEESFREKHCEISDDQVKISADYQKYIIEYKAEGDDNC